MSCAAAAAAVEVAIVVVVVTVVVAAVVLPRAELVGHVYLDRPASGPRVAASPGPVSSKDRPSRLIGRM